MAMGRIDFKEPITVSDAVSIRNHVASLNGIHNALLNANERILVFMYYPSKQNGDYVFKSVQKFSNKKSERYIPNSQELASGCPVNFKPTGILASTIALFN
jgi:hypothetical protein